MFFIDFNNIKQYNQILEQLKRVLDDPRADLRLLDTDIIYHRIGKDGDDNVWVDGSDCRREVDTETVWQPKGGYCGGSNNMASSVLNDDQIVAYNMDMRHSIITNGTFDNNDKVILELLSKLKAFKKSWSGFKNPFIVNSNECLFTLANNITYTAMGIFIGHKNNTDSFLASIANLKVSVFLLLAILLLLATTSIQMMLVSGFLLLLLLLMVGSRRINYYLVRRFTLDDNALSDQYTGRRTLDIEKIKDMIYKSTDRIFGYRNDGSCGWIRVYYCCIMDEKSGKMRFYAIEKVLWRFRRYIQVVIDCEYVEIKYYGGISCEIYHRIKALELKIRAVRGLPVLGYDTQPVVRQFKNQLLSKHEDNDTFVQNHSTQSSLANVQTNNKPHDCYHDDHTSTLTNQFDKYPTVLINPANKYTINERNELLTDTNGQPIEITTEYKKQHYIDLLYTKTMEKCSKMISDSQNWKIEHQDSTYTAKSQSDSVFVIRQTTLQINGTIDKIIAAITDVNNTPKFSPMVLSETLVSQLTEDAILTHVIVKCPFPLQNRDIMQIKITRRLSDSEAVMVSTSAPEFLAPVDKRYVRSKFIRFC